MLSTSTDSLFTIRNGGNLTALMDFFFSERGRVFFNKFWLVHQVGKLLCVSWKFDVVRTENEAQKSSLQKFGATSCKSLSNCMTIE